MDKNTCTVELPKTWVNAQRFDAAIDRVHPHSCSADCVLFNFPVGCKIMADAGVRILSLVNQLDFAGKRVILRFEECEGTMGYLDRMGFFEYLRPDIMVYPERPIISGSLLYHGRSDHLVEISSINPSELPSDLPSRLADTLVRNVKVARGTKNLGQAAFTVFAELIDNIFQHSSTELDGYATLQVYKGGGRAKVAVSDSGEGIIQTLRPALKLAGSSLAQLSDTDLVVETFRSGISRHGGTRGCGLKASADHALRFSAELDVRLPRCRVQLVPSPDGYKPSVAYCREGLARLWGTHICFDFRLDS